MNVRVLFVHEYVPIDTSEQPLRINAEDHLDIVTSKALDTLLFYDAAIVDDLDLTASKGERVLCWIPCF